MPFAIRNGARIHWREDGQGSPVLLIMGHRYSSAMWHPMLPALTPDHRTLTFDNRGTGDSDTTRDITIADLVADALAVMDAAGVRRAHIFGVSMGGGVALELALRHPERVASLILGCTCMLTAEKPRMPAFVRALYHLPPWLLKALMPKPGPDLGYGSAAPAEAIAFDQQVLKADRFTVPGVIAQAAAIAAYCVDAKDVAALAIPALVLHGDEDRTVPFAWGQELAATLPNARFVPLAGAGHNFLVAKGDEARAAVTGFLKAQDQAAA